MVDIAADSADSRCDGTQALQGVEIADVAGVPYLVAAVKVGGVAVVPAGVGVAEDTYMQHQMPIFLAMSRGTAALLT